MHGSRSARFHECGSCGQVVFVTADIGGEVYGALNALCMKNKLGFPPALSTNYFSATAGQKRDRWRQNWCHPVTITIPGSETLTVPLPATSGSRERVGCNCSLLCSGSVPDYRTRYSTGVFKHCKFHIRRHHCVPADHLSQAMCQFLRNSL